MALPGHPMHLLAFDAAKELDGHAAQVSEGEATAGDALPCGQETHACDPLLALNLPASHA